MKEITKSIVMKDEIINISYYTDGTHYYYDNGFNKQRAVSKSDAWNSALYLKVWGFIPLEKVLQWETLGLTK